MPKHFITLSGDLALHCAYDRLGEKKFATQSEIYFTVLDIESLLLSSSW